MIKFCYVRLSLLGVHLALLFVQLSAGASERHIPWTLDGAQDRIEKHRMAAVDLEVHLPDGSLLPSGSLVELELQKHAFQFGVSLAGSYVLYKEPSYYDILEQVDRLFNYITVAFYWRGNETQRGEWRLREHSKHPLDWAIEKGKRVRGHPLVWHNVIPDWIADKERSASEIGFDIMEHAERLLTLYPEVDEWDIYNEAPVWEGIPGLHDTELGIRRWMDLEGGPANVTEKLAFLIQQIRPEADGLVNHFNLDHPSYHAMIRTCIDRGVSIRGIGLQSHMQDKNSIWSESYMWNLMEAYGAYNIPIHFTEVTILSCEGVADWIEMQAWEEKRLKQRRVGEIPDQQKSTKALMERQAAYARDFYTLAFSHPAVNTIVWWALSDVGVWRGLPGGLFDENGRVKPVAKELNRLINEEWHTHVRGRLKVSGEVPLKGFRGTYQLQVEHEGVCYRANFDLLDNKEEPVQVDLVRVGAE
ncbi:MAG: endo-1,4-beta-xylanase [Pontiellaceae bacterium]